jgi:hypothetical protein
VEKMRDAKQSGITQNFVDVDVSAHLEEPVLRLPRKFMKIQYAEFQIPRTSI